MSSVDTLHTLLKHRAGQLEAQLSGYVPRVLVREAPDDDLCPRDAGYVRSFSQFWPASERQTLPDDQVAELPRAAVIGDTGSGKSFILQRAFLRSIRRFISDPSGAPAPFFLDLGEDLIADHDIEAALDHWYESGFSVATKKHEPGCILFLDSLDEKLLKVVDKTAFVNLIDRFLNEHSSALTSVVLACRRALWNWSWFRGVEPRFQVFQADYLDFTDYHHIIPDYNERRQFFDDVESIGIAELLRLAIVGFDLARTYSSGEDLPSSRRDWFDGRVNELLRGRGKDRQRDDAPSIGCLRSLAEQLACLATWGTISSWTVADAVDKLDGASTWQTGTPIDPKSVRVLLSRPLFTKRKNRVSFVHKLFPEYLAAEALAPLRHRKQKLLLTSSVPALEGRILTPLRGVAVALAEASPGFRDYLIRRDPMVALLAETPSLPPDDDERLLKEVIDSAIASGVGYWHRIPPTGQRLDQALPNHRPKDVSVFLQPYFDVHDELALSWATACARAWDGDPKLNPVLLGLAQDPRQSTEVRINAIDAVLASQCQEDIRQLYRLFDARDDQVRGHTLVAYRITEEPSPRDFIEKLRGGALDDSLYCSLQRETRRYGSLLGTHAELDEAFQAVDEMHGQLGDLSPLLLEGLVRQAIELEFGDLPPSLFVKVWSDRQYGYRRRGEDCIYGLKQLLIANRALFAEVFRYVLEIYARRTSYSHLVLAERLAEVCDDDVFDLLPSDSKPLNRSQKRFIEDLLGHYFHQDPNVKRLRRFKRLAPAYTQTLRMPKSAFIHSGRDRLQEAETIAQILNCKEATAPQKADRLLSTIGEIFQDQKQSRGFHRDVVTFLGELQAPLGVRVLQVFAECVAEIDYSRTEGTKPDTFRMTPPTYAVPFWVLWELELFDLLSTEKLDQFLRCYAFLGIHGVSAKSYYAILDRLQASDIDRWRKCLSWLMRFPSVGLRYPLEYLSEKESRFYLGQCRRHLLDCDFSAEDSPSLLQYWKTLRPDDFTEVLQRSYLCLQSTDSSKWTGTHRFMVLWLLLCEDDDWAWSELQQLVQNRSAPTTMEHIYLVGSERLPRSRKRLPTVASWFELVGQTRGLEGAPHDDFGRLLLKTIVDIGGEEAIQELERLRSEEAFRGANWLGQKVIEIQDSMLMDSGEVMQAGELLDFINRDVLGIVRNERDLFEAVRQAIEDEKESIERGEQVGAYWEDCEPKEEPICQNILWPPIKRRLKGLGVVGVEEKHVGPNKADFWVVKADRQSEELQVFVELKVARKGYTRGDLIEPVETQLWEKYLEPARKQFGIYVVLWFKGGRYAHPKGWTQIDDFEEELQRYCARVASEHCISLACYVIDMTAPIRRH